MAATINKTKQCLESLSLVERLTSELGTIAYAWGGFIPDIYNNRIEREHDDVEHLVLDLYSYIPQLSSLFSKNGWITEVLINGDLKARKDAVKIHLGHLTINERSNWYHNGNKGYIEFPTEWLNNSEIIFQGISLHAVKPEFQYVLKNNPQFMNSDWKARQKDLEDIHRLELILRKQGAHLEKLSKEMKAIDTTV